VDVRIIAATNKELSREVRDGRFREDLFYRLNVVAVTLPPLRERKEDIPLLIEHFLRQLQASGKQARTITPEALRLLQDHAWPGNVRELANAVERLLILAPGEVVGREDLPPNLRSAAETGPGHPRGPLSLSEMERLHIARVLSETKGKKMQAARLLGIDLKTLNQKIKRYAIQP
jgi:DNA-binding NtrC family response regulator